jgi:formylmethanofuran dehydrogenase subunit B
MVEHPNVVCPFCGCLCDDLSITVEGNRIIKTKNACAISQSKFMNHEKNRIDAPSIDGNPVSLDEAIEASAKILASAKRPLVYGLSSTECGAIAKAVELTDLLGGVVDNTSSVCHGSTILALQAVGEVKTTLGEVKNRADLIVFWGSNPTEAHLRHLIRYSGTVKGLWRPEGRKGRYIVAVDVRETRMSKLSDLFIKIEPNGDYELLSALRAAVRGAKIQADVVAGVPRQQIVELADRMKAARMGVIFYGLGLTQSDGRHLNVDAAVGLVEGLSHHTKFVLTPMRGHYNVSGANAVTAWQTGYPFAVDFSRGYPRYNPGEYTAVDLLSRGEADAALVIASDPAANFPVDAAKQLAKIPVVTLDTKISMTAMLSRIVIPVAMAGIEAEGTAYRMDDVPIRLRKVIEPPEGLKTDAEVIQKIIDGVKAMRGGV